MSNVPSPPQSSSASSLSMSDTTVSLPSAIDLLPSILSLNHLSSSSESLSSSSSPSSSRTSHQLFIFLDYDGTLSNITANPEEAVLTSSMHKTLLALQSFIRHPGSNRQIDPLYSNVQVCIVTGRSMERINQFLTYRTEEVDGASSNVIPYGQFFTIAASHGYDIQLAVINQGSNRNPTPSKTMNDSASPKHIEPFHHYYSSLQYAMHQLQSLIVDIPGTTIEDNRYSVSFHYRNVPVPRHRELEIRLTTWLKNYNDQYSNGSATNTEYYPLEIRPGKLVWEIRPMVEWGKGHAVMYVLEHLYGPGLSGGTGTSTNTIRMDPASTAKNKHENTVDEHASSITRTETTTTTVICIGDDHTDEDMFRSIKEAAKLERITKAVPIIVHSMEKEKVIGTTVKDGLMPSTNGSSGNDNRTISDPSSSRTMPISRSTSAVAYLQDPNEVEQFLQQLLKMIN